jgi:murein DD-endopeptidase MepM/ murein hydrolase activator NlpD
MDTVSADRLFTSPVSISGPSQVGRDREGLEGMRGEELAREFESMLLLQMLRQMRQSIRDGSEKEEGLSADTMLDTVDAELARQLSKAGGLGLADMMAKAIRAQAEGRTAAAGRQATPGAQAPQTIAPSRLSHTHTPVESARSAGVSNPGSGVETAKVTSDFGWRSDPFTGAMRYHRGIDFKAAYGEGVPAAGDGRVVEAGDNGAYGLTVLVEHPNGMKTRYAHLSAMGVGVGDRVLQGQEIGRVGQSGRATGPHLHFEVIQDGRRVDPSTVVALRGSGLGGLKLAGTAADFPTGWRTSASAISGVDDED